MNDVVIRARDLRKVYRLYAKPSYRFRDMFGLLGGKSGAYTEHAALDGVSLEIHRGEKVAIIGRNGAGKSTFLKLVTGVVEPTSGALEINARVHALLQIGTGFHPDFTGRENVYAYLAQLGVSGREADQRCAEAIEFAELEDYIDQPVKTYSTGMAVRLMFSVSTAITPDLMVLDEVLGVGDAYFAQKSYDRLRELSTGQGTTLLLVTHDIYSAAKLCERVVWIDRGAVLRDGDGTTVVKAYEDSIRLQEEQRLRAKKQAELQRGRPSGSGVASDFVLLELQARKGRPQSSPVYVSRLAITDGAKEVAAVVPAESSFSSDAGTHLMREGGCWGGAAEWNGRQARPMLNYGSPFHKVGAVFAVPAGLVAAANDLGVRVDYWSDEPCDLVVRLFHEGRSKRIGDFTTDVREWKTFAAHAKEAAWSSSDAELSEDGIQGAADIFFTDACMVDAAGQRALTIAHGEPARVRARYEIRRKGLRERAEVFVIISRNTTERVCKFRTSALLFDHAAQPCGVVELFLPKMMLGAGTYSVAVEVAAEGYSEKGPGKFFSVDSEVYSCLTHAFEFTVTTTGWIGPGTIFEGEGEWALKGAGD